MKPDIKYEMPFDDYIAAPGMSKSRLWQLNAGPEHFLDDTVMEPTAAMRFGSWAHLIMLEQDRFLAETCQQPKFDRRTKKGKAGYALWLQEHSHQEAIPEQDMANLSAMRFALDNGNHTMAQSLMSTGDSEVSCFFEWEGLQWKCRFDKLDADKKIITEYKTTSSIVPQIFSAGAINFGYHVAAALYKRGAETYFGERFSYLFVCQEKKPPYAIAVYEPDQAFFDSGEVALENLIGMLKAYKASNWKLPDGRFVTDIIQPLNAPAWA